MQGGTVGGACRRHAGPGHQEDRNGVDQVQPAGHHDGNAAPTGLAIAADRGRGGRGGLGSRPQDPRHKLAQR